MRNQRVDAHAQLAAQKLGRQLDTVVGPCYPVSWAAADNLNLGGFGLSTYEGTMVTAANRGKYAEGKVKAELKKLETANCTHHRFPDAHSGSFVTAPADFLILQNGRLRLLVKQVEHGERLPYGNFSPEQVNRMHMWRHAGADTWVLVYHVPHKAWRLIPAEVSSGTDH